MTDTHHIGEQARVAKELLDAVNVTFDGENDDVALATVEGETSLVDAIDAALERIAVLSAHRDAIKEATAKLDQRSERFGFQIERIKNSVTWAMDTVGMKKLERPTATLSLAKVPDKAVITNEEALPSSFLIEKTTVSPDRKAILGALKAGCAVPGAELSNGGMTLRILKG